MCGDALLCRHQELVSILKDTSMAAFIQKLFKNRKAPTNPSPAPEQTAPKQNPQDEQRQQQLETLNAAPTNQQLEQLAIKGLTADIRLGAVKALDDLEGLQRVLKQAKSRDKGVYQVARQKIQAEKEQENARKRRAETIENLILSARNQANSDDTKLYEARLEALLKQWSEVEAHATAEQSTRLLDAVHQCRERIQKMQAKRQHLEQQADKADQRAKTLSLLEATLSDLKDHQDTPAPSFSSLDALQKTQENRWLEATRDTEVTKQEQKAYESLMQALRTYIAAVRRLEQARGEIAALTGQEATDNQEADNASAKAREILAGIEWPADYPLPDNLKAVSKLAGQPRKAVEQATKSADARQRVDEFRTTLEKLDQALDAKQLKESRQLFKQAQQQFKALDARHGRPFHARMQLLGGQLRELSDWQGFATQPKQVALCEQMEYLAEQPMEPEAKAEKIKELQNEWRNLGGSSDRTLWSRFKQASDKAYEPCKTYFSAKSGLKQANLQKRQAICDELQQFVDGADWSTIDWKAAEQIHRTARDEWKAAWPIEFRDNRPVQKRFDDLLKKIEEPLNTERQKNEALKQDIVSRAQALVDHEPLGEAMDLAKALQGEWKAIGITRHREDRKLWQAFRKACDAVFARRDAHRSEQEQITRDANARVEAILEQTAPLTGANNEDELKTGLRVIKAAASEPTSAGIRERRSQEERRLAQLLDQRSRQKQLHQWQQWIHARLDGSLESSQLPSDWSTLAQPLASLSALELVIRAEIIAGIPSPESDQSFRMEIQVQRLADGLGGNSNHSGEQLEALVAAWCLHPSADQFSRELAQRLELAISGE